MRWEPVKVQQCWTAVDQQLARQLHVDASDTQPCWVHRWQWLVHAVPSRPAANTTQHGKYALSATPTDIYYYIIQYTYYSASTNLLSVPHVRTFASLQPLQPVCSSCSHHLWLPTVQPMQPGTHYHLAFVTIPLPILSVAFLKLTAFSRPSAPLVAHPSASDSATGWHCAF